MSPVLRMVLTLGAGQEVSPTGRAPRSQEAVRNRAGSRKSVGGSRFISRVSFPSTPRGSPLFSFTTHCRLSASVGVCRGCEGAEQAPRDQRGVAGGHREAPSRRGHGAGEAAWPGDRSRGRLAGLLRPPHRPDGR